ncbi:Flp pilus assembly protein CpaB [Alkalilacustris brevis]|uniref:Flp pilus assembly protein CpaB n=1 Tax=Alkalilacustris brevis TaxID=2026338 RepID=UPI00138FA5A1|nr:Flp pilus assembly protein CpaB [Alkalilacustris brevis]
MMRTLILMIATTSGLAAALLTFSSSDDGRAEAVTAIPLPEVPMQEVLVASDLIEPGHAVSAENMNWQKWPEAAVHEGFVTRDNHPDAIDVFSGTIMRGRLLAGEPIRQDRLTPGNASFMSALLPPGKRAVAVKVTAESSAGGFILPNDRVDVLLTRQEEGRGSASTRTILRNVKVLAIDQLAEGAESDAMVGRTATLELDAGQTESITSAEASGMLSLALRSITDTNEPEPEPELPEPEIILSQPEPERAPRTVRIRRAGAVETVTLP